MTMPTTISCQVGTNVERRWTALYTVETVDRVYREIWEAAVGQGNVETCIILTLLPFSSPCFGGLEEGLIVDRRLSGFGRVELVNWKYFNGNITINNSTSIRAKLHYTAPTIIMPRPQKFAKKTFTDGRKSTKFAKVFSLESFPLSRCDF